MSWRNFIIHLTLCTLWFWSRVRIALPATTTYTRLAPARFPFAWAQDTDISWFSCNAGTYSLYTVHTVHLRTVLRYRYFVQLNLHETDLLFRYLSHHLTWHCSSISEDLHRFAQIWSQNCFCYCFWTILGAQQ